VGHFSKKYTHTLENAPTIGIFYQHSRLEGSEDYGTNVAVTPASLNLSTLFYQDLHNFLDSINDFPYETEFVNDEDIVYSTAAATASSIVKIGTMEYIPYISTCGSGQTEGTQSYIPWMTIDPKDFRKSYGTEGIRFDTYSGSAKYGTTFRTVANCKKAGGERVYEWTLHCYYNTHFCVLGFTNENTDKMIPILTQVDAVDRVGRDWYFVTSCPGYTMITSSGTISNEPYPLFEFHLKSNPKKLPTSTGSGIIQHRSSAGIGAYGNFTYTANGDIYTIRGTNLNDARRDDTFINPCNGISNAYEIGKYMNIDSSPAFFSNDMIDIEDVIVAYPIVMNGLMTLTDQVMCASDNIVLSKEYEINGKKYYCVGDPNVTSINMPFLFEFDVVS